MPALDDDREEALAQDLAKGQFQVGDVFTITGSPTQYVITEILPTGMRCKLTDKEFERLSEDSVTSSAYNRRK